MKDSNRLIQTMILSAGIVAALSAIFLVGAEKASFGDAEDYLLSANSLLSSFSYPERSLYLPFFRPPLYPFFIASIWLAFPKSIVAVKVAQAVIFGVNCVIIYRIGAALTQNMTAALLGSLIFLLNPFLVLQTTDIQTETLHTFLFSVAILLLIQTLHGAANFQKLIARTFFAGIFFGLSALCRPSALPLAVVLIAALFFLKFRETRLAKSLALSASIFAGMFLMITPWTTANYQRTGEFILINDASGYALWTGNNPLSLPLYENNFKSLDEYNQYSDYVLQYSAEEKIAAWEKSANYSMLSPSQRENLWRAEALKNMRENPQTTAKLWLYKVWNFWKPYLNPTAYSAKSVFVSGIFLTALFLSSFYGAKIVWTDYNNKRAIVLLAVLFAGATAVHVFVVSMIRYRIPYVDAYFCVLSGIAAHRLMSKLRNIIQNRTLK